MERTFPSPLAAAVRAAYGRGEDDETLNPLVLEDGSGVPEGRIAPGDSLIFYNIRGEREIELTRSLTEKGFSEFPVRSGMDLRFATMIEYARGLSVDVAFPPVEDLRDTLGEVLSARGLPVLKITEAEKATHVGYFFNGKSHRLFPGEKRIIVPTRKDVALFDEAPEMSIESVTETVLGELKPGFAARGLFPSRKLAFRSGPLPLWAERTVKFFLIDGWRERAKALETFCRYRVAGRTGPRK